MQITFWLAQRWRNPKNKGFSGIVMQMAVASVALGLAVIIGAFGILKGFQHNIQEKLFSFSGHIFVEGRNISNSNEDTPISVRTNIYQNAKNIPEISHCQAVGRKAGILKTKNEVLGILFKGIGGDFNASQFENNMIEGKLPKFSTNFLQKDTTKYLFAKENPEIVISKKIADKLQLKIKDSVLIFFIQNPPRFRKLVVKGIYQTGMDEFDEKVILGDLLTIQKINEWRHDEVGGYELFVKDFSKVDSFTQRPLMEYLRHDMQATTTTQKFLDVFEWLSLLNKNVQIFLILILIVASFGMISIILIMIIERVPTIGLLKIMGATDHQIRLVFIYQGLYLLFRGMFWGNVVGIGFSAFQYYTKIIPLDAENYYMNSVPIAWDFFGIFWANVLIFLIVSTVILLPTWAIMQITPIKAIRFD
jgi:lipoprotein-releasing system permease protein